MSDDITLPPLPSVAYIVTDPASTEYGLWRERNGPYDGNQMRAFARAAVLLDRQQRAASQGEAVAHVYDLGILARDRVLRENGPVNNAPLYLAPPAPSAEPVITDAMVEAAHSYVRSELRGVSLPDEYMRGILRAALEVKR